MGCWDVFCFLCGNTCHSAGKYIEKEFLENIEYYESKKKKGPWFKTYFKSIYEKYNKNPNLFLSKLSNINKNTEWLNKCTFLCANNKIIHECTEVSCNIEFQDKKGNYYTHIVNDNDPSGMYGVFLHTDCWQHVKKVYNIELCYSLLPIIEKNPIYSKIFKFIEYGLIEKYWQQDFDFVDIIADSNDELCNSPLKSNLVAKNIKKVISQLKIKSKVERKGPTVSAIFYKDNLYKIGNNGNIWYVKNNKWYEIKNTIKKKIKNNKLLKYFVYSGDINDKPIFVLNISNNEYEIITIE